MPARTSRRLVIDADVASAAGGREAVNPRSKYCRDFLLSVLTVCHHVVMTTKIADEWKRHQSNFSRIWRVQMFARKKVFRTELDPDPRLRLKIAGFTAGEKHRAAMLKDIHLLEVAIKTDRIIASCDSSSRALFDSAAERVGELRNVVWVIPDNPEEEVISWLESGATLTKERRLGFKAK